MQPNELTDEQKRAMVNKFVDLRKTMTIANALGKIGVHRSSIDRWGKQFDIDPGFVTRSTYKKRSPPPQQEERRQPTLVTVPVKVKEEIKRGMALVLMGDAKEIKELLPSALQMLKGE